VSDKRKYNLRDAVLLQHAGVVRAMLPDDLADFATFDASFDTDRLAALQAKLDAAGTAATGDVIGDQLMQLTDAVTAAMEDCNRTYQQVAYFVRKAFPDNRGVRAEFGANAVRSARNNQSRLIRFMQILAGTVAKYRAQLEAAGAPGVLLDSVALRHAALDAADSAQEQFKRTRGIETFARVSAFNALYTELVEVARASRLVYGENEPRWRKYQLPRPVSSIDSPQDLLTSEPEDAVSEDPAGSSAPAA